MEYFEQTSMNLDEQKMQELGLDGHSLLRASAVMRYTVGCIKRERERLAKIFIEKTSPEEIARAILDCSLDDNVFRWKGPETTLNA